MMGEETVGRSVAVGTPPVLAEREPCRRWEPTRWTQFNPPTEDLNNLSIILISDWLAKPAPYGAQRCSMAPPLKSRSVMLTGSIVLARFSSCENHASEELWLRLAQLCSFWKIQWQYLLPRERKWYLCKNQSGAKAAACFSKSECKCLGQATANVKEWTTVHVKTVHATHLRQSHLYGP